VQPRERMEEKDQKDFKVDEEGRLLWKGQEVSHPLVKRYFLSLMDRDEEGVWVRNQWQKLGVDMEGTPFYVEALREELKGGEMRLKAIINDGTQEVLDLSTLRIAPDNKVYCKIRGGKFEALLTLSAYWQLMRYLVEEEGRYYLELGSRRYPLEIEEEKGSGG